LTRSTRERPARSTIGPPAKRPTVIEAAKSANTREPIVAPKPCPSTMISGSQSLAVPSASAIASTTPPMHTSRTSFHSARRAPAAPAEAVPADHEQRQPVAGGAPGGRHRDHGPADAHQPHVLPQRGAGRRGLGGALCGGDLPGPGRDRAHRPDQQSRTDGGSE